MPPRIRAGALALVVLVLVQIYLGALVAGLRAGLIYNTWPLIDGALVPDASRLFFEQPWWRNFFENALMVQFNHRMLAYAIFVLAIAHAVDVVRTARRGDGGDVARSRWRPPSRCRPVIGIVTLLHVTPLPLALAHQAMAVIVLAIAVVHAAAARAMLRRNRERRGLPHDDRVGSCDRSGRSVSLA